MNGIKGYEELLRYPTPDETMPSRREDVVVADHHASDAKHSHRKDSMRPAGAAAGKQKPED